MPRLPAVIATRAPGEIVLHISSLPHCSRSASSKSPKRGLGKSCLTLTAFGNRIFLAPFLGTLLDTRQGSGEDESRLHARVIGRAGTGDVEGRAVVHAGAEERQPYGDIDAGVEALSFIGICPWSWYCTTTMSKTSRLGRIR